MKRALKPFLPDFARLVAYSALITGPLWVQYAPMPEGSLFADHGFAAWGAAAWIVACINAHTLSDIRRAQRKD